MHPVWHVTCTAVTAAAEAVKVPVHGEMPIVGSFLCGSWLYRNLTFGDHRDDGALLSDDALPLGGAAHSAGGGPILGILLLVPHGDVYAFVVSVCRRRGVGVAFSGFL